MKKKKLSTPRQWVLGNSVCRPARHDRGVASAMSTKAAERTSFLTERKPLDIVEDRADPDGDEAREHVAAALKAPKTEQVA